MLLKKINQEVEDFKNKPITIVPGLFFNQYQTLQTVFFYYNSKFSTGDIDEDGDRKYFFNIVKNPCKVFSKSIDFDTKNFRFLTTGGGDTTKTWFMERDFQFWMRDKNFGKVLNRTFRELPIFGTVVLKVIEGVPHFVDLRNFAVEQTADNLDDSSYITEIHNLTPDQFRNTAKKMKWSSALVRETLNKFYLMEGISHIRLYERYGEVRIDEDSADSEYEYRRIFIADVGVDEFDQRGELVVEKPGVLLSEEKWDGHPYWEFHAEKMSGRWLGIGVVESLFEPQIRHNEIANIQSKSSYWAGLKLFFSRDPNMKGNLATDKRNGDVITGDSEVTMINMAEQNLAYFNEESNKWMRNRDELTFSFDVVQGERLPAGTPLGSAQLAAAQTLSYFEMIQENIALDFKEMIYKVIIPQFEKDSTDEHVLRLVGKDLDAYVAMIKNDLVAKEVIRLAIKSVRTLKFPTSKDRDVIGIAIEESIKQGKEHLLPIPKGFYKDVKYDFDIDITGESVDTRVRSATKFAILQAITADPTITTDPTKRKLLMSFAEDGGVNPTDIFDVESKQPIDVVPGRAGGGVSAPRLGTPQQGQTTQTI